MMFNNIEEISANKYLNTLDDIVPNFGLAGNFVECTVPGWEGMYYVLGMSVKDINSGNFDIVELLQRKARYNEGLFHTDIHIIPITDRSPFSIVNDVFSYCRNAEFIGKVYHKNTITVPDKITIDGLNVIKMAYVNSINPSLSKENRDEYAAIVKTAINEEKEYAQKMQTPDKSTNAKMRGSWDDSLSDRQNRRIAESEYPNKTSLEHLISRSGVVNVISIRYDKSEAVMKELAKCSHAIYWMSDVYGEKLPVPAEQGYGNESLNDLRKVYLAFDNAHTDEVRYAVSCALYPAAFDFSNDFASNKFGDVSRISIPVTQYHNFANLFKAKQIPFAYDDTCNSYRPNELNLIVPTNREKDVELIFDRLTKEIEDYHIETSWEKQEFQKSINEQLTAGKSVIELGEYQGHVGS